MQQLTPTEVEVIVGVITVVTSWIGAAFIAGVGWGRVKAALETLDHRLTIIEGMFKLTLKDDN